MNMKVNNTTLAASAAVPLSLSSLVAPQIGQTGDAGVVINTSAPHANNAAEVDGLDETAKVALSGWWSEQCQKVGFEWSKSQARGSTLRRQTIAMLSLEVALFPSTDWDARLTAMNIEPTKIRSKHKLAKAVAATFALDPTVAETKIARQAGKMIDRFALSVEWLASQITAMSPAELKGVTFDDNGIQKLVDRLKLVGGVTKASDTQRAINNGSGKIVIDRFAGAGVLAKKGAIALRKREGLADTAEVQVGVNVTVGASKAPFKLSQRLIDAINEEVFEAACEANPVVNILGELAKVGAVVGYGKSVPQFILRPDRSILISSAAPSEPCGPIVVVRPKASIFDPWPTGFCSFQKSEWQFVEANLVDADRRKYFDASVMGSTSADNVASIELTTSVLGNEKALSYIVDVLPIASGLASYPLEFTLDKFNPEFAFAVSRADLKEWGGMLPTRVGPLPRTELMSFGHSISFTIGSQSFFPSQVTQTTDRSVTFAPGLLLSVLRMLASLPLTDADVAFEADPLGGMHIRFATDAADYELYMQAIVDKSSSPDMRDLRPITVA